MFAMFNAGERRMRRRKRSRPATEISDAQMREIREGFEQIGSSLGGGVEISLAAELKKIVAEDERRAGEEGAERPAMRAVPRDVRATAGDLQVP